jgi:non-specific serine/threonine protein kinase
VAHLDMQPFLLLVSESGTLRLAGLEVAAEPPAQPGGVAAEPLAGPRGQRAQQDAAQRDVLSVGVLMHEMLTGRPVLEEADVGRVLQRLPPAGRDIARLAWDTPQPIPEPLRAIVNRATDRQERQRYRSARTLAHALEGWLKTAASQGGGPLVLLLDRLRTVGVLPSAPGAAERALRLTRMERQRTNELAEVVLQDMALAFELLRVVNTAQVHGAQVSGDGPVLTVRRAIAMLGLEGVRRAALSLRPWPGPLAEAAAADLENLMERVKRAGRVAVALRPAGYDGEVVYLVTLLQNLGRLIVQYHFADEAVQIRRLMQPAPAPRAGETEEPGMSEEGASFAVLGADIESIGAAVARHWGLTDDVLHMVRRLPVAAPLRGVEGDDELLRATGSCANEVVDALALPAPQVAHAMQRVVQRYGRPLALTLKDLQAALQPPAAPISMATAPMGLDPLPTAPAASAAPAGGARAFASRQLT